jgi:hypothetical protein
MLTLGSLAFATPIALLALILLPGIWWLLRLTPPAPKRIPFPPVRFLAGLASTEESAARTPPWLLVLRIVLALAVVFGAAHPLINAGGELAGSGPLVLVVDDGWAAARDWPARQAMMNGLIDNAEREGRSVAIATTAATDVDAPRQAVRLVAVGEARKFVRSLQPKPWETDRLAAVEALIELAEATDWRPGAVMWLSDGLDETETDGQGAIVAELLKPLGAVTVVTPSAMDAVKVLRTPAVDDSTLVFTLIRPNSAGEAVVVLRGTRLARPSSCCGLCPRTAVFWPGREFASPTASGGSIRASPFRRSSSTAWPALRSRAKIPPRRWSWSTSVGSGGPWAW